MDKPDSLRTTVFQRGGSQREGIEDQEEFRGRIGFDFTKDNEGRVYCFEFNGHSAGISGMQGVDLKEFPDFVEAQEMGKLRNRDGRINPPWLEAITHDKAEMADFIPPENYPGAIFGEESEALENQAVVIKPRHSAMGRNVVVQRFIRSVGAERAPENLQGRPTSMRLLLDFSVYTSGKIRLETVAAYQRVSPYGFDDIGKVIEGKKVTFNDVAVVNWSRDAKAVPASIEEVDAVMPTALKIIKNLAAYNRTRPEYAADIQKRKEEIQKLKEAEREKARGEARSEIYNLWGRLQSKYSMYLEMRGLREENDEVLNAELDFFRGLERELGSLDYKVIEFIFKRWPKFRQVGVPTDLNVEIELRPRFSERPYVIESSLSKVGQLEQDLVSFYNAHPLY